MEAPRASVTSSSASAATTAVASSTALTIGFIGHPNAGKTSLLNAIVGRKVASVSRTPGHTKHLQTWVLSEGLVLCDSPGLVFPVAANGCAVVPGGSGGSGGGGGSGGDAASKLDDISPRAVYECCGLFPIAQGREPFSAIRLLWHAIDLPRLYNLTARDLDDEPLEELSPLGFCAALAERKGYRLARGRGALDVHRAGLEVLRDCVDGAVCLAFVDPPPAAVPIA